MDIAPIIASTDAIRSWAAAAQQENADLTGTVTNLSAQLTSKDATIRDLRLANDQLASENDGLEAENTSLQAWISNHNATQHASDLPLVTPLASKVVHEGYGICQHADFRAPNIHQHQAEIFERYAAMHVHQFRSKYVPSEQMTTAISAARAAGIKMNATVATIESTKEEIESRIRHMAANASDVVAYVEGINEPNPAGTSNTWVPACVDRQKWIYEAVHSYPSLNHVIVLGPSMHDVKLDGVNGLHWKQLVAGGIKQYMDRCAIHCYPGASTPDSKRAERVQWVHDAFGANYPIKFTEWGYNNTLGKPASERSTGAKVIPASLSAIYDAQAVFDFANNGWEVLRYEFLDDPEAGGDETKSFNQEWNFGVAYEPTQGVTGNPDTTWKPKPAVAKLTTILGSLEDRGAPYTTTPVQVEVKGDPDDPNDLRFCLVQNRDGETTMWMWRHGQIWNPNTEVPTPIGTLNVTVVDVQGEQPVTVGADPVAVTVRT